MYFYKVQISGKKFRYIRSKLSKADSRFYFMPPFFYFIQLNPNWFRIVHCCFVNFLAIHLNSVNCFLGLFFLIPIWNNVFLAKKLIHFPRYGFAIKVKGTCATVLKRTQNNNQTPEFFRSCTTEMAGPPVLELGRGPK